MSRCPGEHIAPIRIQTNGTLCTCMPGFFFNKKIGNCVNFEDALKGSSYNATTATSTMETTRMLPFLSGMGAHPSSFILVTVLMLAIWLLLSLPLLFFAATSGIFFRCRVALRQLDNRYYPRHFISIDKCLVRRSTELGGVMTVASWIIFSGLASSAAYETITSDTIAIQYLAPAGRDDIKMIRNDIEINITVLGYVHCSQLVRKNVSIASDAGYKLKENTADFGIPTCLDTEHGARLRFLCKSCILASDSYTFTWAFEDRLDIQLFSTAIGFEVSASTSASKKHHSTLHAVLPAGQSGLLTTFRGSQWNVITLNFIPWVYKSKGIPRLFQIAFHSYTPGSSSASLKELEASYLELQGVKTALQIRVLSQYLVETTYLSYFGIYRFLAYLGGHYILCRYFFQTIMLQFEMHLPNLLNQEKSLNRLVAKERAREHWAKVRVYVTQRLSKRRISLLKRTTQLAKATKTQKEHYLSGQYLERISTMPKKEFVVRQFRKPNWIRESEALPLVPEPPIFANHFDYGHEYKDLLDCHEYLKRLSIYTQRLRRDFIASLVIIEKISRAFESTNTNPMKSCGET